MIFHDINDILFVLNDSPFTLSIFLDYFPFFPVKSRQCGTGILNNVFINLWGCLQKTNYSNTQIRLLQVSN